MSQGNLGEAFNTLLSLHSRKMTIERPGKFPATEIRLTPSNYSRNLTGPEDTAIKGREFVISKKVLDDKALGVPKRGDRLIDPDLGVSVINEVREMFGFGGAIIGYRIRTG